MGEERPTPCEGVAEGSGEVVSQRLYEKEQAGAEGEEPPGGDELPADPGQRRWGQEHREQGAQLGRQAQPPRGQALLQVAALTQGLVRPGFICKGPLDGV